MSIDQRLKQRFVRLVLAGGSITKRGTDTTVGRGKAQVTMSASEVAALIHAGVLAKKGERIVAGPAARAWLTRMALSVDSLVPVERRADPQVQAVGVHWLNTAESPLARLARPQGDEAPFLDPHHVEAGERLRRLAERARMNPRVTLSYDPTRLPGGSGRGGQGDVADSAIDARRRLGDLLDGLPSEMAGVVLDVCGLLKGLQQVETERNMPRRSGKLVLRLALDLLARRMGLAAAAKGRDRGRLNGWLEARPEDWT
jgi:hypothetical protein